MMLFGPLKVVLWGACLPGTLTQLELSENSTSQLELMLWDTQSIDLEIIGLIILVLTLIFKYHITKSPLSLFFKFIYVPSLSLIRKLVKCPCENVINFFGALPDKVDVFCSYFMITLLAPLMMKSG